MGSYKGKMATTYLPLLVVVAVVLVVSATATSVEDRKLKSCQHECRQVKHFGEERMRECEKGCEQQYSKEGRKQREGKGGESDIDNPRFDPQRGSRGEEGCECRRGTRREEEFGEEGEWGKTTGRRGQESWRGSRRPQEEEQFGGKTTGRGQQEGRRGSRRPHEEEEFGGKMRPFGREGRQQGEEEEEEYSGEGRGEGHPFVFKDEHFQTTFRTQQGRERSLPKFSEVSNVLKGIENFRVDIFEAKPSSFMLPKHCDADAVIFVAKGSGTITLVHPENKNSFNVEKGHIIRIRAGSTMYLVNSDEEERLVLIKLVIPVSNTGRFEMFFGAGGQNPESFFNAFSDEILEAAFKSSSDELERIFNQQNEGAVVEASREQIQSLSKQGGGEGGGSRSWPFGGGSSAGGGSGKGSRGPIISLFRQKPSFQNEFGSLFMVDSDDFQQLQDLDVAVSFANITEGGMMGPLFNTRATRIAVVVKGEGQFEMACPHAAAHKRSFSRHGSRGGRQGQSPVHYRQIRGNLEVGTVFIVPTGHPYVTVASQDENLHIIFFEVNAENNRKIQLAGQKSILKQFDSEAKELAFGEKADFIDDILERQDEEFFFPGPQQQRQRGRHGRFSPTRRPREEEGRADQ